jgi:hypothetical protein
MRKAYKMGLSIRFLGDGPCDVIPIGGLICVDILDILDAVQSDFFVVVVVRCQKLLMFPYRSC